MVLADGSIETTSSSENADLFWAIHGGGSNFGVCTEFILKLHPQHRAVFGGMATFPPQKLRVISKALEEWHHNGLSEKEAIYLIVTGGPDGKVLYTVAILRMPLTSSF